MNTDVQVAKPDHASYRAQRSFGSLDGIRCLSIVAVVWHHTRGGLSYGLASTRGFLAVDLFFVLSGFLIVTLLLRERETSGDISLKAFYARRTLRIFPLYYGVVFASLVLFGVLLSGGETGQQITREMPYLLTYTTNWVELSSLLAITWSLAAEEQFYLLWPPVQKYVSRPLLVLAALIIVSQVIHFGLADSWLAQLGFAAGDPPMLHETTFTPILFGVLLAYLLHERKSFDMVARCVGHPLAPIACLLAVVAICQFWSGDLAGWPRLSLHIAMLALLASCVVREDHALARYLKWAPLRRLGVLSYGMYLLHMFANDPAQRLVAKGMPQELSFPVALLLTVLLAEASFRWFETPFLKMKARFAHRAPARSESVAESQPLGGIEGAS